MFPNDYARCTTAHCIDRETCARATTEGGPWTPYMSVEPRRAEDEPWCEHYIEATPAPEGGREDEERRA